MKPILGVKFIQGDIKNYETYLSIIKNLNNKRVDLLMSDLSPKTSGHIFVDVYNSISLSKKAFHLSKNVLSKKGFFVTKVFQGNEFNSYIHILKKMFLKVKIYKPYASRSNSREIFIVAKNIKRGK